MSRVYLSNPLVLLLGSICFYEKCLYETGSYNKATIKKLLKCKETSKLKTETFLLLKGTFIWYKVYRVVNHSMNMGVVELWGEWPSSPAKIIGFTEVKHGCVRSETGWATFQINDQKTAHSTVLRKGR